jgi:hypothetical protein
LHRLQQCRAAQPLPRFNPSAPALAPQIASWTANRSQVLNPGDSLITSCVYDSSSRTDNTTFGASSSDEM